LDFGDAPTTPQTRPAPEAATRNDPDDKAKQREIREVQEQKP